MRKVSFVISTTNTRLICSIRLSRSLSFQIRFQSIGFLLSVGYSQHLFRLNCSKMSTQVPRVTTAIKSCHALCQGLDKPLNESLKLSSISCQLTLAGESLATHAQHHCTTLPPLPLTGHLCVLYSFLCAWKNSHYTS